MLDNYYQVPNGSDNRNIEKILDIVKNEKIEFILPGADEEAICISNSPEQVDSLLSNFDFDLIQVPFNVFDARLTRDGQLSTLKNKNVEIHTRSAFLQGMLLNFDNLPKHFKTWEKQFNEYQAMVKESGMS